MIRDRKNLYSVFVWSSIENSKEENRTKLRGSLAGIFTFTILQWKGERTGLSDGRTSTKDSFTIYETTIFGRDFWLNVSM